jgi:hypothetical protein
MTATQEKNSVTVDPTTTPACPSWCGGQHDAGNLTTRGRREWRDEHGQPAEHDGDVIAAVRDHTHDFPRVGVWVDRSDALLMDGTWRVGRTTIGTWDGDLTVDEALALAMALSEAAAIVTAASAE